MTETSTRIGNGTTTLRLPLTPATEDTLPQMRDMVVVVTAIIPTLIRTAARDGPHSPRTTIIVIGTRATSSLLHSATVEETRFLAATKRLSGTGTSLDHLLPATTVGAIQSPETMVVNTPTLIEAVATPRVAYTRITITMPTTTVPPTAHLNTADPHTGIPTIDREYTRALHRMAPITHTAAGTAETDPP